MGCAKSHLRPVQRLLDDLCGFIAATGRPVWLVAFDLALALQGKQA